MKQKLLLPILLLTLALVVAACGDSESSSNRHPISAINVALSNAAEAKSYKFDGVLKLEAVDGTEDETFEMSFEGQTNVDGSKSWMKVDMGALFDVFGDQDSESIMETRIIDGDVYSNAPSFFSDKGSWEKVSLETYSEDSEEMFNPADALAHLRAVSDNVENLGKEKINGEDTNKYRATTTKEDLLSYVESEEAQTYFETFNIDKDEYKSDFVESFEDDVTTTVWINGDDNVSRIQMESISQAVQGENVSADKAKITITVNFSEWDKDFDVEVPEVVDRDLSDFSVPNLDDFNTEEFNMEELEQLGSRLNELQM